MTKAYLFLKKYVLHCTKTTVIQGYLYYRALTNKKLHYIFIFPKLGDRYWYENDIPPSSFTREQLNEIRKVSMAQIICENIPSIGKKSCASCVISRNFWQKNKLIVIIFCNIILHLLIFFCIQQIFREIEKKPDQYWIEYCPDLGPNR